MSDLPFPHFIEMTDASLFKKHIQRAKKANPMGAAVDVHKVSDYKKMKLFTTRDGLAGFAVHPNGELNSVFKHPDAPYSGVARRAAEAGILMGGATHASAFDAKLPDMYASGGLAPLSHVQWNEEYKPPRWKVSRQGRPDVAFLGANPSSAYEYNKTKAEGKVYRPKSTPEVPDYETGMNQAEEYGRNNVTNLRRENR